MSPTLDFLIVLATLGCLLVIPLVAFSYVLYFLVSLPLRRQERARILIDLLATLENQHRPLAVAIREFSQTKDPALGVRFHLLAGYLETGKSFQEAVRHVPRLLPKHIQQALVVGESIGDYRKVIPICHAMLNDAASTVRSAMNHLVLLLFVTLPTVVVLNIFGFTIWPMFQNVVSEFNLRLPPALLITMNGLPTIGIMLVGFCLLLYIGATCYIGGPRLQSWLEAGLSPFTHRATLWVPWRRKRLLRNFSLMLSLLLDENVPEVEAINLAAQSTANRALQQQAKRCATALETGLPLEQAIARLDPTPELGWRLRLAARHAQGFRAALRGWWEWLHAQASRQEQSAAQIIATGIVVFNGLMTTAIACSVFYLLISVIEEGVLLW